MSVFEASLSFCCASSFRTAAIALMHHGIMHAYMHVCRYHVDMISIYIYINMYIYLFHILYIIMYNEHGTLYIYIYYNIYIYIYIYIYISCIFMTCSYLVIMNISLPKNNGEKRRNKKPEKMKNQNFLVSVIKPKKSTTKPCLGMYVYVCLCMYAHICHIGLVVHACLLVLLIERFQLRLTSLSHLESAATLKPEPHNPSPHA